MLDFEQVGDGGLNDRHGGLMVEVGGEGTFSVITGWVLTL